MKNKPLRHKSDNTFKFQPFAERITNIDVDIFHRVPHANEAETEDLECFFYQTLQKWNVLNLTESYDLLRKEVSGIITLPQLLHRKDHVVEVLLKYLKLKNPLSLQPVLELVVALSKDLQKEFYPYYAQFLYQIIEILNTKDTEVLEWTFVCLAYLCKNLWRYLIKDINVVFKNLVPLLSDKKPEYVNNFAAESFAFVARKVKDRQAFLQLILNTVKTEKDGVSGCGKLLFEVIRGVQNNFHSCAGQTLVFYFESLSNEELPQDILYDVLQEVVKNITLHMKPKNTEIFWSSLVSVIDKSLQTSSDKNVKDIELLMTLLIQILKYKEGKMLITIDLSVKLYLKFVQSQNLVPSLIPIVSEFGSILLISQNIQLSQEHASNIIRRSLAVPNDTFKLDFIKNMISYAQFEALILPAFLNYYKQNLNDVSLKFLTEIIIRKSPISYNGINYLNWEKYTLDFNSHNDIILKYMLKILNSSNGDDFEKQICVLIILPHLKINPTNLDAIKTKLEGIVQTVLTKLGTGLENGQCSELFLLANVFNCMTHLVDPENVYDFCTENNVLQQLLQLIKEPHVKILKFVLSIIDLILTAIKDTQFISMENLVLLHGELVQFFSSPFKEVRLLICHIYTLFESLPELVANSTLEKPEAWNIFSICFNVESTESLVQTYRDQLQNLQKLSCDKPQGILCKNTEFNMVPLKYLLGVLYINFQLLWEPATKIIATYAQGIPANIFWEVFSIQLHVTEDNIKRSNEIKSVYLNTDCEILADLFNDACEISSAPDYVNYRQLLWKAMCEFSDVAEARNRDIVPLMLNFVEEEYRSSNNAEALISNIKKKETDFTSEEDKDKVKTENEDSDNEDDTESNDETDKKKLKSDDPVIKNSSKVYLKTLLQQLTFFSKIRNPKNLHREPELYKLYLDLLSHRNSEVQKTALDCIMVYKHKYLIPYKENLYSLIDDRKFKDELSSFRIDKDTNIVQDIHRKDLIQIVLRIVFSKMMVKTGLRTGGKSSGQMRRLLVLRFLAGCQENEMMDFIHMIFKYCSKFLSDDPWSMVKKISDEVDLEKCIPPKRLQSTLNLIQVILDQFGGLMSQELLSYILKILFVIGATIYGILKQRSAVYNGYISVLKNLRSSSLTILKRFFEQFDTYAWTNNEINAVFSVFIWPWLNKLSIENVHTPTPLLKLCLVWCHNPRYYKLLVKYEEDQNEQCILKEIINVLMTEKLHPAVASLIMEMFEKLLSLKPDEEENVLSIETDNILPIADHILERLALKENLNYGSCILLPFIPSILQKLKKKLTNKNKGISAKETFILSRISELVWEPEICDKVLELLLPIVFKKACSGASEEIMIQLTTTIFNLTKYVNSPYIHVKGLAPLFSEVTSTGTRKLLCEILKVMSTKSEKVDTLSNVVSDLNAFDTRWVEQPDFDKRLDGFKQISKIIDDDNLELDLGVIAVYNCFYMIRNEKDLALRESSVQCLRNVVPYLIKKYQHTQSEKNYLLNDVLLDLIRRGITNKNEQYRHASISLLGHIARECPDSHITLSDLSRLSNKTDLEADFFENLLHLQLYRQTRALNRFSQHYQGEKIAPNVRTLTQFILPLTSSYLLVEKYAQKNSLIDSAVEALKTICKLLPWHQYESILKFYLGKLRYKKEFQRQLVKIVVAVLDAYHFDLSKAHVNYQNEIKQTLETEMNAVNKNEKEDGVEDNNEQKLEEILEGAADLEEIEQDGDEDEKIILPINRQFILSPSAAKRVIHSIQNILLPQLHRTMAELTQHEASHKVNRKKTGIDHEEEELQKVPISLAVVKLLQRLPTNILNRNLPGVFTKLCSFFKSHLESVRRAARETLQKIMCSLGPDYLGLLLNQMSSMLSHGFQVHVLVYTVHSVLVSLKELYKPGNIDKCLLTILELCKTDLFGAISEEKEVAKIGSKVSEAKSTKSFDTFQILAQYITEKCLMDLILPLKDVLMQTHSFKIVNKVQECLRRIALGLIDNTYISTSSLLVFAYGTSSESIPQFLAKSGKKKLTEEEKEKILREKTDCYIIPKATTGRSGIRKNIPCTSAEANSHLLVEFGLKLCQFLLKREKLQSEDYSSFLDPFILVFKNCLSARHVKMCTLTLHCLSLILKFDLPSLQEHIKDIAKSVFDLLHKYAAAGLSKGDNFDLVVAAFKMVAILVRDVRYYNIETDQLKSLLLYAEQDLHDYERQATAFGLLKAIISRKLIIPEIHDVMKKVSELSITSELPHVRQHCRQVFHHFLLDYPLGKKLDIHLAFYLSQLNYEGRPGRESALEMIHSIISTFPIKVLKKHSGMFFVMLGARLVNDEAPECRKMVAKSLQLMLERIDKTDRDSLFDIVKEWFKEKKISHRRLAAQLCGLIVLVEKSSFEKRLPEITSDIIAQFTSNNKGPGRFVRLKPQAEVSEEEEKNIKPEDHHLFQVLQMLLKICAHCPSFLKNVEVIEILSIHIQCLLAYPHEWVRLAATQFIGYVLSVLNIQHLSTLLTEKTCEDKGYLYSDPQNTVKSLTLDLCDQLQAGAVKTELAEQVVKNLVFMARVLQNVPNEKTEDNLINLHWLTRRMRKIVNMEVVRASKSTILRTEVFKWIAGVVTTLDADKIKEELHNLLAPLVREMTSIEQSNAPLRQLGKEVGGIIKKKVGNEDYISMLSKLETQLNVRRAERKRERAQLAVVDPEAAAKKKIKLHEKKKEAKKRKIEEFKGKKSIKKKRKVVELDSSEVM